MGINNIRSNPLQTRVELENITNRQSSKFSIHVAPYRAILFNESLVKELNIISIGPF
jgi:hypothetical protein